MSVCRLVSRYVFSFIAKMAFSVLRQSICVVIHMPTSLLSESTSARMHVHVAKISIYYLLCDLRLVVDLFVVSYHSSFVCFICHSDGHD